MVSLIELILKDPLRGLIVILFILFLYLWREQAKIKIEIKTMERFLDDKKLDREDFKIYSKNHEKIHDSFIDHLKMAVGLLKK